MKNEKLESSIQFNCSKGDIPYKRIVKKSVSQYRSPRGTTQKGRGTIVDTLQFPSYYDEISLSRLIEDFLFEFVEESFYLIDEIKVY